MTPRLILASQSPIRARLLAQAGIHAEALPARIDEDAIRTALEAEAATSRDIADTLRRHRDRYGLTYFTVQDYHGEYFAQVISALR